MKVSIRRAVLTASCVAALGVTASSASAGSNNFTCGGLDPNSWCAAADAHSYDGGAGLWNSGASGSINLCAKLIARGVSPEYQYARKCQYTNGVIIYSNDFGRAPRPNYSTIMIALVANGANANRHIITGEFSY